jgi:putative flippase GtrA
MSIVVSAAETHELAAPVSSPGISLAGQFLRYLVVGGIAFVADFGVLVVCTEICGIHYLTSAAFGFAAGVLMNYLLSIAWVFSSRAISNRRLEFAIFVVIGVLGLGLNELAMWTLVALAGLAYPVAKLVAAGAILVWNFSARKLVLFN